MKKIFILTGIILFSLSLSGQIQVRLHRPLPEQTYIEKLWWVDITNLTGNSYSIYLKLDITESRAGKIFSARSNLFTLAARTLRIRPSDITGVSDVTYNPEYRDYIIRTGKIPPGKYTICVSVINSKTGAMLGNNCYSSTVLEPNPPRLISPKNGSKLGFRLAMFSWSPPSPLPPGTRVSYKIKIVELFRGQSPIEAMASNRPWFEKEDIRTTSFTYSMRGRRFEGKKIYAWQIQAFDENGFPLGRNNGKSSIWIFKIPKLIPSPSLPGIIKIGDFIITNISYNPSANLNSLSGSGETYFYQTVHSLILGGPPVMHPKAKFSVQFSGLKGIKINNDTIKITDGEIIKSFSKPLQVNFLRFPIYVHNVHFWPDSAHADVGAGFPCIYSQSDCQPAELGPFDQKVKPILEIYKDYVPGEKGPFRIGETGILFKSLGRILIDLSRTITPDVYIKFFSGSTVPQDSIRVSNIGFLYGKYSFTNGIVSPLGFSATLNLAGDWSFKSLEPYGFDILLHSGSLEIEHCKIKKGKFTSGYVELPFGKSGVSNAYGNVVKATFDSLMVDSLLEFTGDLMVSREMRWGGFGFISSKGKFRLVAEPRNFDPPVAADTFKTFTYSSIDTLTGLTFIMSKGKDTLKVYTHDAPHLLAFSGREIEGWININVQGISGRLVKNPEYFPPKNVNLGLPGSPGYGAKTSFSTVIGPRGDYKSDTLFNVEFQFAGNSAFNSDIGGIFKIPYPCGKVGTPLSVPFNKLTVTSTASIVGGNVTFADTLNLEYWGVGLTSERGVVSIKGGEIVYTNADIYEPIHFSEGFNIIWGEMLADGNLGKFYFNQNAAHQKFDGFPITLDSAALSEYDPSKNGELVVKCGIHFHFFGEPDTLITIHDERISDTHPPYYGRKITLDPDHFSVYRNWGSDLAKMDFKNVSYDDADQNGFRGTGSPDIEFFKDSPLGATIIMDSLFIQICMTESGHHSLALPPSNNTTIMGHIWGCATIEGDELKRIVIGGRIEGTAGLILVASGGGGIEVKMVITPNITSFRADGIMFLDVTGVGNVELTGSVSLTCDRSIPSLEGEVKGALDFSAIASGLEADGQVNWHIGPSSFYFQGKASVRIYGLSFGGGLGGGVYLGFNAPKSKAWVLMEGSSSNRRFGINTDNLPTELTGVYIFGDLDMSMDFGIFSGGIEIYAGVGAFLKIPTDSASYYNAGLPLPYVVAAIGVYLHGEILWGLVSAAAWGELQIVAGNPVAFQGTVGLEGCVLWVLCATVDVDVGLSYSKGFYIE